MHEYKHFIDPTVMQILTRYTKKFFAEDFDQVAIIQSWISIHMFPAKMSYSFGTRQNVSIVVYAMNKQFIGFTQILSYTFANFF